MTFAKEIIIILKVFPFMFSFSSSGMVQKMDFYRCPAQTPPIPD